MIEFRPDELKWQAILNEIRRRIREGQYQPGHPIPGEPRLAEEFGVARGTARRVINELLESGEVYSIHGKGTFVAVLKDDERQAGKQ
ncbi:GntR family transcriptional regulator [Planomonospora sp. ID82291]|uniref:GntR family transcriptional regulator n=1 Tax=Planomonospora sp. ID82291 TaxID=2738136 RepID=UPI0018C433F8|nr:GntR family transcriptional regulator [Planomonospora sp. ID82291]MBG0814328.1 GntR family transcriptional regulator [Planomonospora sp. ID82291]